MRRTSWYCTDIDVLSEINVNLIRSDLKKSLNSEVTGLVSLKLSLISSFHLPREIGFIVVVGKGRGGGVNSLALWMPTYQNLASYEV